MKKLFFLTSAISVLSLPIVSAVSCAPNNSSQNFEEQYNLFTPDLVVQKQVKKNLPFSIDENLIGNIYLTPELNPGVTPYYSFEPTSDSLKLFVELYNNKNILVPFSKMNPKKEIVTITKFAELEPTQKQNIKGEYEKFNKLKLKPTNALASSIKNIEDIPGWVPNFTNNNFKYEFKLVPDDLKGNLIVSFTLLTSSTNYPLKIGESASITVAGYETITTYQSKIDAKYNDSKLMANISVNDLKIIDGAKSNIFASSLTNKTEWNNFLSSLSLKTQPIKPNDQSIVKSFETNDFSGEITITTNIYNKLGELLEPTSSNDKTETITGFRIASSKLLIATMRAYRKFSSYDNDNVLSNKKIPSDIVKDPRILEKLTAELITKIKDPFEISETLETFEFKVLLKEFGKNVNPNDSDGIINYNKMIIQYNTGTKTTPQWLTIRPPSDSNGAPSSAINNNTYSVYGFLTTELLNANKLYIEISDKIKSIQSNIRDDQPYESDFDSIDLKNLWELRSTSTNDPLGIPFKHIGDRFLIKYSFSKINESWILDKTGKKKLLCKTTTIKASVCSANDSSYEIKFVNINSISTPSFEFTFSVTRRPPNV